MKAIPRFNYVSGNVNYDGKKVFPCIKCYMQGRGEQVFESSINSDLDEQLELARIIFDAANDAQIDMHACTYKEGMHSRKRDFVCNANMQIGIVMYTLAERLKNRVKQKVDELELGGVVDVLLKQNFDYKNQEWKLAAEYAGRSVDIHEMKVDRYGHETDDFKEFPNEVSADQELINFFSE